MNRVFYLFAFMACLSMVASASADTTVSLASQMATTGGLSEDLVTGSVARIGFGGGGPGDNDGLYDITNPSIAFGGVDLFPNEENFGIGSFTFDETSVSGVGIETVSITDLDTSLLWTSGSATTDISDAGLGLWFFGLPSAFTFSSFDAADTATFTDGLLTSIDANVDSTFSLLDGGGNTVVWNGGLSFSGDNVSLLFNDTQAFDTGFGVVPSTFTSDLTGTVNAVGTFSVTAIPEPASASVLSVIGVVSCLARRRRR